MLLIDMLNILNYVNKVDNSYISFEEASYDSAQYVQKL